MRKTFLSISISLFSLALWSQEMLTIEEAISRGLEQNLEVKIIRKNNEVNTNNYEKSIGGLLPRASLTASRNFSVNNVTQQFLNDKAPRAPIKNARTNTLNISPALQWTIFNGLGMFATRQRLKKQALLGEDDLRVAIENNIAAVSNGYYRIVLEKERLRVFQDALRLSKDRAALAKTRYELGKSSKLHYLQAQVDFNTDKSKLIAQQELIFNVQVDLNQLMGADLESTYTVSQGFDPDTTLVLETLLNSAFVNNPGILRARRVQEMAYLQHKETKAQRYPVINLNLGYNYNDRNSDAGFLLSNISRGWNYGISASFTIFNGFDQRRREQNNRIAIESNQLQLENLKLQLEAQVRKAYINYQNSIQLKNLEELNFEVAKENYDIALERYKLGNATPIALREAQVNFVQAEIRKITSQYTVKIAEIELTRLGGYNLR